jgi:hypothetical protein
MDCNRIPSAQFWDQCSPELIQEYRRHARSCFACRKQILLDAPDQLLTELDGPPMPDEFWIGFWDSLEKKLPAEQEAMPAPRWTKWIRRTAAVAALATLAIINQKLPESPSYEINRGVRQVRPVDSLPPATAYPLIEDVQNPAARYYIIQSGQDQKIVMIVDPNMEM